MTVMATVSRPAKPPPKPANVREAWQEYLEAVKDQAPARYDEVEGWAWARLETRLRVIRRQTARKTAA